MKIILKGQIQPNEGHAKPRPAAAPQRAGLPFGLARIVPPNLLGFAVINSFTFGCDLAC